MCGRYTLATDLSDFLEQLGIQAPPELLHPTRYNIAPSQPVVALVADPEPRIEVMEWGFIPSWAKPGQDLHPVINARADSLIGKPYFKGAFKSSRCALLADGFYEWQRVGKEKYPFRIGLKEGGIFAMAGLWSEVHGGDGSERITCAIVTVEPNELMRSIHDRMPAILKTEDIPVWLDRTTRERELLAAIEPYPADQMRAYEVGRLVNSPANDLPECIKPIDEE